MRGRLFVLSGPSGAGKSTVISSVMEKYPNLRFSVSATTRAIRPGEVDGKDYFFVTKEAFREMIREEKLLEYTQYVGNSYGTPSEPVQHARDNGVDILLDIEPDGAMQVRRSCPDAVLLFLAPPSIEQLEKRLMGRGDTAPEAICGRLEKARWEIQQADKYDYIIINDDVEKAVAEVLAILTAEKCRASERFLLLDRE